MVYEHKRCLNWFVATGLRGFEKSTCHASLPAGWLGSQEDSVSAVSASWLAGVSSLMSLCFFSNGSMDSQEDSASTVSPGLLVSLVNIYEHKRCFNWFDTRFDLCFEKSGHRTSASWLVFLLRRQRHGFSGRECECCFARSPCVFGSVVIASIPGLPHLYEWGRPGTKAKVVSQLAPGRQLSIQAYYNFPT